MVKLPSSRSIIGHQLFLSLFNFFSSFFSFFFLYCPFRHVFFFFFPLLILGPFLSLPSLFSSAVYLRLHRSSSNSCICECTPDNRIDKHRYYYKQRVALRANYDASRVSRILLPASIHSLSPSRDPYRVRSVAFSIARKCTPSSMHAAQPSFSFDRYSFFFFFFFMIDATQFWMDTF